MDLIVAGHRYLSIVGREIDKIGQQGRPSTMPDAYHYNRVSRDQSEGYHITFAHPRELQEYLASRGIRRKEQHGGHLRNIVTELVASFGDPSTTWELPVDMGLGRLEQLVAPPPPPKKKEKGEKKKHKNNRQGTAQTSVNHGMEHSDNGKTNDTEDKGYNDTTSDTEHKGNNGTANDTEPKDKNGTTNDMEHKGTTSTLYTSYFRVIHWPFGQKLRAHLGLPPCSFHVTVGFDPKDIHAPKGLDAILLGPSLKQDPNILVRWAASAVDYPEQTLFLKRLNQHLIKVNLEHLAEPWQHHIKEDDHCNTTTSG